jgi:ABC-2 type transport system ATP-binding protein
MSESTAVVRLEKVVKDVRPGFGLRKKRILHGVSIEVERGEIFGFVGPNGAGKTTTMKILMGLIRATSGRATILGHEVGETAFRSEIGFLPENPYFYDYLTGREILEFYARLSGMSAAQRRERVGMLLEWVGLSDAAGARLSTYSKGMLQRVGIAQALVHDPSVIFLDEPMSGLDPIGRKEIRDLIVRLREEGKTVFMNTHILSDVEILCDRVAIIAGGRIRYQGRIETYLEREGQAQFSDIVLGSVTPELAAWIEENFELDLRGVSERVELQVPEKRVGELLALAIQSGASVISVAAHRPSLESVFLSAVRASQAAQ